MATPYNPLRSVFRGMAFSLPLTFGCWWLVFHNPKSRFAFVFGNIFFAAFIVFVLVGFAITQWRRDAHR